VYSQRFSYVSFELHVHLFKHSLFLTFGCLEDVLLLGCNYPQKVNEQSNVEIKNFLYKMFCGTSAGVRVSCSYLLINGTCSRFFLLWCAEPSPVPTWLSLYCIRVDSGCSSFFNENNPHLPPVIIILHTVLCWVKVCHYLILRKQKNPSTRLINVYRYLNLSVCVCVLFIGKKQHPESTTLGFQEILSSCLCFWFVRLIS